MVGYVRTNAAVYWWCVDEYIEMITPEQIAKTSEHSHQVALFAWSAQNVAKYPELKYLFAIPNGFFGSAGQKAKMKAEGLRSGVPDIMLPIARNDYHGLFIELKTDKGKLSVEQSEWLQFLSSQGYWAAVCYGWEAARDKIVQYLELGK